MGRTVLDHGILIAIAIFVLLIGTIRSIGRRLLDGVEPDLLHTAEHALLHVDGVEDVTQLRLRWSGHRLQGDAVVQVRGGTLADADRIVAEGVGQVHHHLRVVDDFRVRATGVGGAAAPWVTQRTTVSSEPPTRSAV